MGLFSFIKNAGQKLFSKEAETNEVEATSTPTPNPVKGKELENFVNDLGFNVQDLSASVMGDIATLRGTVDSQANKELIVLAVGNTDGIAQVDDQMVVEVPEPEAKFYTVESGDSLSKIAKEFYGNAMKYPVIFEANKPMLSDPDKIYPGQVLRIPNLEETTA